MAQHWTALNYQFDGAPRRIVLKGDKARPEPAQHIIEFPGGAVEVSRLDDGTYWAHIIVTRRPNLAPGAGSVMGEIVDSRIDRHRMDIGPIDGSERVEQIAVLIRPWVDNGATARSRAA
jgi:hypothetical protein